MQIKTLDDIREEHIDFSKMAGCLHIDVHDLIHQYHDIHNQIRKKYHNQDGFSRMILREAKQELIKWAKQYKPQGAHGCYEGNE